MIQSLQVIQKKLYEPLKWIIEDFYLDSESSRYSGATFLLQNKRICFRKAKITPKKIGQFVAVWKRTEDGQTRPYHRNDDIDFLVIHVEADEQSGQFVFSKEACIEQKIFSTDYQIGKRGFRIYPPWDNTFNKQSKVTQGWQKEYFFSFTENNYLERAGLLYGL